MRKCTSWLTVTIVAVASFSASADIVVPEGFVVHTLLDQIDGTSPRLEAIRDPNNYGIGVVAASVDNGILTVLRISESSVEPLATMSGFPQLSWVRTIRFDTTGLMANELYITVGSDTDCSPPRPARTTLLRVSADGTTTECGESLGDCTNSLDFAFDFTSGASGYMPGAYLEDASLFGGTSLYHLDTECNWLELEPNHVPDGRTDLDIWGMEFDPTGLYGAYLTMADSDNNNNTAVIYQLLPDLTWLELTTPVTVDTRYYKDMAFSPGGVFGQLLYATDCVTDTVMTIEPNDPNDPNGQHAVFASGFNFTGDGADCSATRDGSITLSSDGEYMYVSDSDGVYLICYGCVLGPTLVMREPWVENDDVHTGENGVNSLRLLWSERVDFEHADITITNEDEEPIDFSVSGSNSQFMIIAFWEVLLCDRYTITVHDSVVSVETGTAIDGDEDGFAGGDAVLIMEHRNRLDHDNDNDIDLPDLAALLAIYGTTCD